MKILLPTILLIIALQLQSDFKEYEIPGMTISLALDNTKGQLIITGWAKTTGWVCVGFNEHQGIVGADLKMLAIQDGRLITSDRKTLGTGVYPEDIEMGGINNIENAQGELKEGKFQFSFAIPLETQSSLDQSLTIDKDLWIILAYSAAPEFDHHSSVRKHFKFQLSAQH